jgi:hypothetical protein
VQATSPDAVTRVPPPGPDERRILVDYRVLDVAVVVVAPQAAQLRALPPPSS